MSAKEPVAVVDGKPLDEMPRSLYVPPSAMRVLLERFEGPLDLLHYLIRKDRMDIVDIPMADLTRQYLAYVDGIVDTEMELVADYLLMAATLIEIKSRMLLPQPDAEPGEEDEDPRAQLVERLVEYARIRGAAERIRGWPVTGRDRFVAGAAGPDMAAVRPRVAVRHLQLAMLAVSERRRMSTEITFAADAYTVREAMAHVLIRLRKAGRWLFSRLLGSEHATRPRLGVFFLAALQLAKERLVRLEQRGEAEVRVIQRGDD